jgi:hypothetical protein
MKTIITFLFLCLTVSVFAQKTKPAPQQEDPFFGQFKAMQKQMEQMLKAMPFDQNHSGFYWDTTIVQQFPSGMSFDTTIIHQFAPGGGMMQLDSMSNLDMNLFPSELRQMMNQMMQQFNGSDGGGQSFHLFGMPSTPSDPNAPRDPNLKRITPAPPATKSKKKTYTM